MTLFADYVLKSLMSDGNLPALQGCDVVYEIYTTATDRLILEKNSNFIEIRGKLESWILFRFKLIEGSLEDSYAAMSACHRQAIETAEARDAAILFLQPDVIVGNGTLVTVRKQLCEGKRLVMAPGLRTVREEMEPLLNEGYGRVNGLAARELAAIAVKHIHPISQALVWGNGRINSYCSHLYWPVGEASLYARCAHMHPLMVYPRHKACGFAHTIDWDYFYRACPDESEWFVASSSEEVCLVELSGRAKFAGSEDWRQTTPETVANFLSYATEKPHLSLLRSYYLFQAEVLTLNDCAEQYRESEQIIGAALSDPLGTWQSHQEHGNQRVAVGDFVSAIQSYTSAINGAPPNSALHFLRGHAQLALERFEEAAEDFALGLKISPDNNDLLTLLDHAVLRHKEVTSRIEAVTPEHENFSGAWIAHQERGRELLASGDLSGAFESFTAAINDAPLNMSLYLQRGRILVARERFEDAAKDFSEGLTLNPDSTELAALLKSALAQAYVIALHDDEVQISPSELPLTAIEKQQEVIVGLEEVLDLCAESLVYQRLGDARIAAGDYAGAIEAYTQALICSPNNPAFYFLRGIAWLRSGSCVDASNDFQAGLLLAPDNGPLQSLLAETMRLPPIHLVTQLWGITYVSLFAGHVLGSLMSDENLPVLRGCSEVVYEIYTSQVDRVVLESNADFIRVREKLDGWIEFRFQEIEGSLENAYAAMSACHRRAIAAAEARDAAILFLQPDVIVGNGSLKTVRNQLYAGKRLVMAPGLRTTREDMEQCLAKSGGAAGLTARALTSMAVENMHPISQALVWTNGQINSYCSHLYWPIGTGSLYARCAHMHPLMVFPRRRDCGFDHTIDWDYFHRACPEEADWFIASSTEDVCLIELSGRTKFSGTEAWRPSDAEALASFLSFAALKSHISLLQRPYLFEGRAHKMSEWANQHMEAERLIDKALLLFERPLLSATSSAGTRQLVRRVLQAGVSRSVAVRKRLAERRARKGGMSTIYYLTYSAAYYVMRAVWRACLRIK